jgi:hypothetical protein
MFKRLVLLAVVLSCVLVMVVACGATGVPTVGAPRGVAAAPTMAAELAASPTEAPAPPAPPDLLRRLPPPAVPALPPFPGLRQST